LENETELVEVVRPKDRAYYPSLDGLRAVSFLAVFCWHYLAVPYGWAGVDVFFVLSGFLITGILYDSQDAPHRVRNFYIRRTLRIFPLYYGVLLAILLLTPWMRWAWSWQWIAWPLYLGNFLRFLYPHMDNRFVSAFADAQLISKARPGLTLYLGHFWTLCVEEQFYLVWHLDRLHGTRSAKADGDMRWVHRCSAGRADNCLSASSSGAGKWRGCFSLNPFPL
jgi:peptidoglycan/LPS O-acetylase OafA/YrhL